MINYLVVKQCVGIDVLCLEGPLQIEAWWLFVFILDPSSLLQGFLDVPVATLDDEYFGALVDSVLLSPCGHICNIQEDLVLGDVPLDKRLKGLVIRVYLHYFFLRGLIGIVIPFDLGPRVLLFPQRRCILHLLKLFNDLHTGHLL